MFCVDTAIARWCAAPIELGHPGFRLVPLVLGPDLVPVVTDPAQAADQPELAVLSARAHGANPAHRGVLDALIPALAAVDDDHVALYSDLVLAALPRAARGHLEELMRTGTYEYQSEFVRRLVWQGRAEGRAAAVLEVLDARGVDVPEQARVRITGCTDTDQLDTWIRRAATAETVEELFA